MVTQTKQNNERTAKEIEVGKKTQMNKKPFLIFFKVEY